ncbi:MAG: gamma-glutamyltransferase [Solirubrobacteraceae bacterium]
MRWGHRGLAVGLLASSATALAVADASASQGSRFRAAVHGRLGVVATESPAAGRVGRRVLERGGNAVDAAVATVFALNVARPQSCGIGGGGFALYRRADGRVASLDFRERAPFAFTPRSLVGPGLHRSFTGHLTVGVPGTVAGMDLLLRRYGTRTLAQSIAPAASLARRGVRVTRSLSASMTTNAPRLKLFPTAAAQYLRHRLAYPPGSILRQPVLARTLGLIARHGPGAFYRGVIAGAIIADMRAARRRPGDAARMALSDLAAYRAKLRPALVGRYRGDTVITVPPPSSGGTTLIEILNILSGFDLRAFGPSSTQTLHVLAEAQKLAWADRDAYVADPDRIRVPVRGLISPRYAAQRRAQIDLGRAQAYGPGRLSLRPPARASRADANPGASTTHVSVIDRFGSAIALTCTIEQEFGSAVVAPGTGFLLNNELTDFGEPGSANQPGPGKRPRSSMAPAIVLRGRTPVLVVGAAGGARIIMGVVQTVLGMVDFGRDIAHAVDAERIDDPAGTMTVEDARVTPEVIAALVARGHLLTRVGEYDIRPRVQAAGISPRGGLRSAVSDPRADEGSFAQSAGGR